jgi:hypothetical protein
VLGKYLPASQPLNYAALLRSEGSLSIDVVFSDGKGKPIRTAPASARDQFTKLVLSNAPKWC